MSVNLQYNYAQIDPETKQCIGSFTCSYEIPIPTEYIPVPRASDEYYGKYYNFADENWYYDASYTEIFEIDI